MTTLLITLIVLFSLVAIISFGLSMGPGDAAIEGPEFWVGVCCLLALVLAAIAYNVGQTNIEQRAIVNNAAHYVTKVDRQGDVSHEFVWGPAPK